jgi:hypothetical protein
VASAWHASYRTFCGTAAGSCPPIVPCGALLVGTLKSLSLAPERIIQSWQQSIRGQADVRAWTSLTSLLAPNHMFFVAAPILPVYRPLAVHDLAVNTARRISNGRQVALCESAQTKHPGPGAASCAGTSFPSRVSPATSVGAAEAVVTASQRSSSSPVLAALSNRTRVSLRLYVARRASASVSSARSIAT